MIFVICYLGNRRKMPEMKVWETPREFTSVSPETGPGQLVGDVAR
jgi:hypothetical protein